MSAPRPTAASPGGVSPGGVTVGIDIGGTRTKAVALADPRDTPAGTSGEADGAPVVLAEAVLPTPAGVGDVLVQHVHAVLDALGMRPARLGLVVPGLVDDRAGVARWSANLGLRDHPAREQLSAALGIPVTLGHDVRGGLYGEHRFGAARDCEHVLFVPLGTGIAGALLSAGRVVLGSDWTGEIGHVVVEMDGPLCGCGARGCLEAVASAAALGRLWAETTGRPSRAEDLLVAVADRDERAVALWERAVRTLAQVVAPVAAAAGTELVLLGGGLANAGPVLVDPVRERLDALLPGRSVRVAVAQLGDRAGALGAAAMAWDAREKYADVAVAGTAPDRGTPS